MTVGESTRLCQKQRDGGDHGSADGGDRFSCSVNRESPSTGLRIVAPISAAPSPGCYREVHELPRRARLMLRTVASVSSDRRKPCPGIGHQHAAGAFMWHRRIYYHLAAHAHRAGPPPVDLVSEDGTVKALVLLLAFAATLLAGSERIYVANTGGADISVIDPATNSVIGVIRVVL